MFHTGPTGKAKRKTTAKKPRKLSNKPIRQQRQSESMEEIMDGISGDESVTELAEKAREDLGLGKEKVKEKVPEERARSKSRRRRNESCATEENSDDSKRENVGEKRKKRQEKKKARKLSESDSDDSDSRDNKKQRRRKRDSDEDDRKKGKKGKNRDSEEEKDKRKKKDKKRKRQDSTEESESSSESDEEYDNFAKLAMIWKLEARPRFMQKKKIVNRMTWKEIMETRREFREECRQNGMGEAMFAADAGIPTKRYAAEKDNRTTRKLTVPLT